jgi:hypothetical protein
MRIWEEMVINYSGDRISSLDRTEKNNGSLIPIWI